MNLTLVRQTPIKDGGSPPLFDRTSFLIYPRTGSSPLCPPEVPADFAEDFNEASLILDLSPKASAALSRRCLQHILEDMGKVKPNDLSKEIQQILDSHGLPPYLSERIDAIRAIGNIAAHPTKDKNTGDILPVEPGEAEWLLGVVEDLLEFYFVGPAKTAKKNAAITQKLSVAGKLPLRK
jgi:hypothetical protein